MNKTPMHSGEAQRLLNAESGRVLGNVSRRALEAVVDQAEQIKRLQAAVRFLESVWGSDIITELREKGIITAEDMEDTDE